MYWLPLEVTNRRAGNSSYLDNLASVILQKVSTEWHTDLTAMLEDTTYSS
jgi:hypothetical protein